MVLNSRRWSAALITALLACQLYSLPAAAAPAAGRAEAAVGDPRSLALNEQGAAQAKAGKYVEAEAPFREALAVDEGNLTAVFNLSAMYLTNKREREAITLLKQYTTDQDKDAGLFVRLGDAYFATKELEQARGSYETALKIDKAYPGVPAKLGTVFALLGKTVEAEQMYARGAEQAPKDRQILANLSSLYLANGKPKQAVETAKKALQIEPSGPVYFTLGNVYEVLKDYRNALVAFERAKELGDQRPELAEKIKQLKRIAS